LLASAVAALVSCTLVPADAAWSTRAKLETAGYADDNHVSVLTPSLAGSTEDATRGLRFGGSYLVDVVSAASVDIVSTASKRWREVRHAGTLDAKYKPGVFGVSANGYASVEPDYRSIGVGGAAIYDFRDKLDTATFGYAYANDVSGRAGTPFDVFSRVINRHTFSPGITLTIDRATVISFLGDATFEVGDTSKPYRYVPFFTPTARVPAGASIDEVNRARVPERALEQLPTSRERFALAIRLLHRWAKTTLRLNERLYTDSWGMFASTTDARLPYDLSSKWRVFPHARFHIQNGASFWDRAYRYDGTFPSYWTGDRELSPLRTYTLGGGIQLDLHEWIFGAQADGMYTQFLDALYIKQRLGILGSLTVERVFE
jgi:hypothetical protein